MKASVSPSPSPRQLSPHHQSSCPPHRLQRRKVRSVLPHSLTSPRVGLQFAPYIERKVIGITAAAAVKQPSPAPTSTPVLPQRTRLAQQQSHRPPPARGRQIQQEIPGPDEDAE